MGERYSINKLLRVTQLHDTSRKGPDWYRELVKLVKTELVSAITSQQEGCWFDSSCFYVEFASSRRSVHGSCELSELEIDTSGH